MSDVLNPALFKSLQRRFGEVNIVAEGQAIAWSVGLANVAFSNSEKRRKSREIFNPGEEYRINCPFCNDLRGRCYINHRWGVWDEETESFNLHLCQCFNEQCLAEVAVQKRLYEIVFLPQGQWDRRIRVKQGVQSGPRKLTEISPPGPMIRIDQLRDRHPKHRAISYVLDRGWDVDYLAQRFDISYCLDSNFGLAQDRLIIPVYMDDMMVGWQARYIGDNVDGVPFNVAKVPKYWTSPGMFRRMAAYNYDAAIRHRTILIVEGPSDVWAAGPCAMGLLGKTMNHLLIKKFVADMRRIHDDLPSVFVVLDPKQDEVAKKKNRPHHIDKLFSQLSPSLPGKVAKVNLNAELGLDEDDSTDPGSLARSILRKVIHKVGEREGLPVCFGRPVSV